MMKKLNWCLATLAVWCGAASAADNPLEQVSKDADLIVRISSFDTTVEHIASLANAVQPGTGDLVSQNATAFGLVLSNPAMAGVDKSKDFYLFLFVREEGEPKALFAIPTTDGAALQGGLPKNFVSEVRENWVFYADADHGVPAAVTAGDSLAKVLNGSRAEALLNKSDIGIHINVDHIASVYDTKIKEGRRKFEDQLENGLNTPGVANPAATVAVLQAEMDIAFQILEDMETLTVGLTASEAGLSIDDYIDFADGSEVANFLESHPKSAFKALSRLSAEQPFYLGMSGDPTKLMNLVQEIVGPLYDDPAIQQGMKDYMNLLAKTKTNSIVMSLDLAEGENGLFAASTVIDTKAAADIVTAARAMGASMKSVKIGGLEQQTTLVPEAETIGTRKVDVMTVKQSIDESQPGAEMQQKISKVMFGEDGMQSRFVALADGFLQVQGGGKPAMEAALQAYDSNGNSLTEQRAGLANEANVLLLLDLPGLIKNGLLAASSVPDLPLPFQKSAIEELDVSGSYIGSTTVVENHGVSIETRIPTEQFQGIMSLVMFFQTQGR